MDPYVYPGTSVLRNLRDIRAPERLARFEADATSGRISELEEKPVTGTFDSRHLQTINKAFGELEKERYLSGADLKRFST